MKFWEEIVQRKTKRRFWVQVPLFVGIMLSIPTVRAQDEVSVEDGVEITRDADELRKRIADRTMDPDSVHTALVFTNTGGGRSLIRCIGYNHNGRAVGRAWLRVPTRGLRFILTEDLSHDRDFIGLVKCQTAQHSTKGSAFLLAPYAITDLPAEDSSAGGVLTLTFPVTAHY